MLFILRIVGRPAFGVRSAAAARSGVRDVSSARSVGNKRRRSGSTSAVADVKRPKVIDLTGEDSEADDAEVEELPTPVPKKTTPAKKRAAGRGGRKRPPKVKLLPLSHEFHGTFKCAGIGRNLLGTKSEHARNQVGTCSE